MLWITALALAAYRANHAGRDAYRQERGGFRGGTDNQTVMRPRSWRRRARIGAAATGLGEKKTQEHIQIKNQAEAGGILPSLPLYSGEGWDGVPLAAPASAAG